MRVLEFNGHELVTLGEASDEITRRDREIDSLKATLEAMERDREAAFDELDELRRESETLRMRGSQLALKLDDARNDADALNVRLEDVTRERDTLVGSVERQARVLHTQHDAVERERRRVRMLKYRLSMGDRVANVNMSARNLLRAIERERDFSCEVAELKRALS